MLVCASQDLKITMAVPKYNSCIKISLTAKNMYTSLLYVQSTRYLQEANRKCFTLLLKSDKIREAPNFWQCSGEIRVALASIFISIWHSNYVTFARWLSAVYFVNEWTAEFLAFLRRGCWFPARGILLQRAAVSEEHTKPLLSLTSVSIQFGFLINSCEKALVYFRICFWWVNFQVLRIILLNWWWIFWRLKLYTCNNFIILHALCMYKCLSIE